MGKSTGKSATSPAISKQEKPKPAPPAGETAGQKRGWNEIEDLFDAKKKNDKATAEHQQDARKRGRRNHKKQTGTGAAARKQNHKSASQERRNDVPKKRAADKHHQQQQEEEWVDDGLGGRFNAEGFTGRVEDGVKVFKAHVLSKPNAGTTAQCPFDCDCCYI